MIKKYNLSVHQLVDFVLRKGDLDDRYFNNVTMAEGVAIHQYYQAKQNENYEAEVSLKTTITIKDYIIDLEGRCDGIIKKNDGVVIDEIKSYVGELDTFFKNNGDWHLGQAICYAYIYSKQFNLKNIEIYLTYISQDTKKENIFKYSFTYPELEEKVFSYIFDYLGFLNVLDDLKEKKNKFLENLSFPFNDKRKGQDEFINFAKKTVLNVENNFAVAPTGIGKTMASIYGTLLGCKDKNIDKIFYLTPKNSGFKNAVDAIKILNSKYEGLKAITISSKERMCLSTDRKCNPDNCPFARKYYEKLNKLIIEILINNSIIDEHKLIEYAFKYDICPFEFSLDLSLYIDVIICDYNYVFHPIAHLKRFFENPDKNYKMFLLVDEAHNLVSRSRDMYSQVLGYKNFLEVKKELSKLKNVDIRNAIKNLTKYFNLFKKLDFSDIDGKEHDDLVLQTLDVNFINALKTAHDKYKEYLNNHPLYSNQLSNQFFIDIFKFLKIYELIDENFKIYIHRDLAKENFEINIFCLDASNFLLDTFYKVQGSLFFSATLTPIEYYKKLILQEKKSDVLLLHSPFKKENLNVMINTSLSLFYKDREKSIFDVINLIQGFVSKKIGNYLIFVPSFEYLFQFKKIFKSNDANFIYQRKEMNNKEKEDFLSNFVISPKKTTIGVAVLGGSFSEGIDLVDDRLIGVVVIGVGLPSLNFRNNLLLEYFNSINLNGYDYAYLYVGMNHVLQAVGRLIRTETDRGSILLIDKRYAYKKYKTLFPSTFDDYKNIKDVEEIKNNLVQFYKN